jgi:hypothetical protein
VLAGEQNIQRRPALFRMPLFYFDIRLDKKRMLDDEALWDPNLQTAEREAREVASEIMHKLRVESVSVSIRDRHSRPQMDIIVAPT